MASELWEVGVENPFLQSFSSRPGKKEKGQDPWTLPSALGGLDRVTNKTASCGGQRNREKIPSGEKECNG